MFAILHAKIYNNDIEVAKDIYTDVFPTLKNIEIKSWFEQGISISWCDQAIFCQY